MHLNDHQDFSRLDSEHMIDEIHQLPDQIKKAWKLGQELPFSITKDVRQIVIVGMGGSAIGASLLTAYAAPLGKIPVIVHRNYDLPAWAQGRNTLCIASSHSGNTEETLSAFETALEGDCQVISITTGGKLARKTQDAGASLWKFNHQGQPRAAVGYSFTLLLAVLARLDLIPDPSAEIEDAVKEMKSEQKQLLPELPIPENPAKRLAGQLVDRWVSIFGAGLMAPVARRWKGQLNELAKAWGQFEALPEADHNTLAGVNNPEEALLRTMALFLRARANHPRNQLRIDLTKKNFMLEGLNTDFVNATGESRLAQQWTALHLGDYVAYYLAMIYDVDPTPVDAIETLKAEMKE